MTEEPTKRYESPLIAVIGSEIEAPSQESHDCFMLGYGLRRVIENGGSICTGGTKGVGVETYKGILSAGRPTKFRVIVPPRCNPSQEYFRAANKKGEKLEVQEYEDDEGKPRISSLADLLITINGSFGTSDEAIFALALGKQVVCLEHSGGTADRLISFKKRNLYTPGIDKNLIIPFQSVFDILEYLKKEIPRLREEGQQNRRLGKLYEEGTFKIEAEAYFNMLLS